MQITLSVAVDTTLVGAVWELDVSAYNETGRIASVFGDDARLRISSTQTVPEFDTQLSMVSTFC